MKRQHRLVFIVLFLASTTSQSYLFGQSGVPCAADQHHEIIKHKEHPVPTPSRGKALVFLMTMPEFGKGYQVKIALDHRRWAAATNKGEYAFFETDPGQVTLSWYQQDLLLKEYDTQLEANHTYFLVKRITFSKFELEPVSEAEGMADLEKLSYVTFESRGKWTAAASEQFNSKFLDGWKQLRQGITPDDVSNLLGLEGFATLKTVEDKLREEGAHHARFSDLHGNEVEVQDNSARVASCGYQFQFIDNRLESWRDTTEPINPR